MIEKTNSLEYGSNKQSFWDRNILLFRIFIIILSIVFTIILTINTIRNATTVFSGTHYMMLPSQFYIQKPLYLQKLKNNVPADYETIPVGSFLLGINNIMFDSNTSINSINKLINEDSVYSITVFSLKNTINLKDLETRKKYYILSDTFIVKNKEIKTDYFRQLNEGVFIGYLEQDGATEIAGVKAGDVLLRIIDTPLKMVSSGESEFLDEASLKFLRSQEPGVPVPYHILRNNKEITTDVRLATFGLPIKIVFLILQGFLFFIFGILFSLIKPQYIAARLTGLAFILIGFFLPATVSNYPVAYDLFTYLKVYLYNVAFILFLPVLLHSIIYFPSPNLKLIEKKYLIGILYIFFIINILVFSIFYFYEIEYIKQMPFLTSFAIGILYFITIKFLFRKYQSKEYKTLNYFINALWIFGFLTIFINPISVLINSNFLKTISEYSHLFLIVIPLVYFYAIAKYKLLGIDIKIKRGVQYFIISTLWKIILLVIFIFLIKLISEINVNFPNIKISGRNIQIFVIPLPFEDYIIYNKIFFSSIIFLIILAGWQLNKVFQKFLDKKYYRGSYDYMYAQTELTKILMKSFSVDNLANTFVRKVTDLSRLKNSGVILFSPSEDYWGNKIFCFDNTKAEKFSIEIPPNILNLIKTIKETININYLSEELREFFTQYNFHFIIPIVGKDRNYGLLLIGEKLSETALNSSDIDFISALTTSASVGIENSLLYEELAKQERIKQELEIAHKIQVASLPQYIPEIKNLDIAAKSIPALEVGGDFYDFLNGKPEEITIIVGDVSGKGTYAALYMSKVQGIFQTLNEFYDSPSKLLIKANKLLYKHIDSKSFITAICANFNSEKNIITLARAGHLPMFYFNKAVNEVRKVQPEGLGLGLSNDKTFEFSLEQISINYKNGDIFIFATDGITEAMNLNYEQYGDEPLIKIVKELCNAPAETLAEEIINSVKSFSGNAKQHDDITIVVIKSI